MAKVFKWSILRAISIRVTKLFKNIIVKAHSNCILMQGLFAKISFFSEKLQWFLPSLHSANRAKCANLGDTFAGENFRPRAPFSLSKLETGILAGY